MSKPKNEVVDIKAPESGLIQMPAAAGISKAPESGGLDTSGLASRLEQLALELGMDMNLPANTLVAYAVEAANISERYLVSAGLGLLKAKNLCRHGEFEEHLQAAGMPRQRSSELMAVASLVAATPVGARKQLLQQPKKVLIGLARMDDEIREQLFETGVLEERLTLAEYHAVLDKKDKLLALAGDDIKRLQAQARSAEIMGRKALDAATPLAVAQLRREAASYAQDALACISGFVALTQKLQSFEAVAGLQPWVAPASLSLVSLLQSVHEAAGHMLTTVNDEFGLDRSVPEGPALMMALPGPEETALIRDAMTEVLIDFERRHTSLAYGQYLETREKFKSKGRPKKAPQYHGAKA